MPDEKEYKDIKAGVEGVLSDVPAPSEAEVEPAPQEPVSTDEASLPSTSYADAGTSYSYDQQQQQYYGGGGSQIDMERVHEIIEAIVSEKWEEVMGSVGNLAVWKEKVNNDLISTKQELVRLEERFEQLQNAVLGRVREYDEGIKGVHTEMKALEKVFEKILEPLTTNIKELTRITQELKKIKH